MVEGLEVFLRHFAGQAGKYAIIGGTACDYWMEKRGLSFRRTKDLDVVLLIETFDKTFSSLIWDFVRSGRYAISASQPGKGTHFRFDGPQASGYPRMIELFCRRPDRIVLAAGQTAAPVMVEGESASLSAILLDDDYYGLIRRHVVQDGGLSILDVDGLVALKARAWLNINGDIRDGKVSDRHDLNKHRNDVFRLGAILPDSPAPEIPDSIRLDVLAFLDSFPNDSPEWPSIIQALRSTLPAATSRNVGVIEAAIRRRFSIGSAD